MADREGSPMIPPSERPRCKVCEIKAAGGESYWFTHTCGSQPPSERPENVKKEMPMRAPTNRADSTADPRGDEMGDSVLLAGITLHQAVAIMTFNKEEAERQHARSQGRRLAISEGLVKQLIAAIRARYAALHLFCESGWHRGRDSFGTAVKLCDTCQKPRGLLLPDGKVISTPLIQRVPGMPTGKARPLTPAPREHRRIAEFKR